MKLRFSIRDLLWLTLVIAMAVAWWIDHHDIEARQGRYVHFRFTRSEDSMYDIQTKKAWNRVGDDWVQAPQ